VVRREAFHCGCLKLQTAVGSTVRLRHDKSDLMPRDDQRVEGWNRELRRATKNQLQLPLPVLLHLFDLAECQITLQPADPIDEEHAVQVVNLMLQSS